MTSDKAPEKSNIESTGEAGVQKWDVNEDLVGRLARAARVDLTDDEKKKFTKQLKGILEAFKEIDEVDTEGVEPSFHPQPRENVWRDDKAEPWDWDPLANSKNKEDGFIKGSKIV